MQLLAMMDCVSYLV